MTRGVGMDLIEIARIERALDRRPRLADRIFTPEEQRYAAGKARPGRHLAARFAAKEALAKALGAPAGMHWQDAEVHRGADGRPHFEVRGTVDARVQVLGITAIHVSLSHDAGIASAVVVAEGPGAPGEPSA